MKPPDKEPADRGSRPLLFHDFAGRVKEGIRPETLLERLGPDPLRFLAGAVSPERPREAEVEFVKAKYDKGSRVYRLFLDVGAGREELFLKTFDTAEVRRIMVQRMLSRKGLRRPLHYPEKILKMAFSRSLARKCWIAAEAARAVGLLVADHILYLSRGRGFHRQELLVCRGINPRPAPDARSYFDSAFRLPNPQEKRRKQNLIVELGRVLHAVKKSGIMFPDFKLHNLVLQEPDGVPPRFFIVDLSEAELNRPDYPEAVFLERFSQSLPPPPVFTRLDRFRLLRAYLAADPSARTTAELCRKIAARAEEQGRKIQI